MVSDHRTPRTLPTRGQWGCFTKRLPGKHISALYYEGNFMIFFGDLVVHKKRRHKLL